MNKIIEAAKQALEVAKCEHELIPQPQLTPKPVLDRFYCPKCEATFYQPRPSWRS